MPTARRSHSHSNDTIRSEQNMLPANAGTRPAGPDPSQGRAQVHVVEHFIHPRHEDIRPFPARTWRQMVGPGRFERPTSPLSGVRSNRLSYGPEPGMTSSGGMCGRRPGDLGPPWALLASPKAGCIDLIRPRTCVSLSDIEGPERR